MTPRTRATPRAARAAPMLVAAALVSALATPSASLRAQAPEVPGADSTTLALVLSGGSGKGLACGGGTGATSSVALPMQEHWDAGNAVQHAMERGDLPAARAAAARIADVGEIPGLTWDAGPYLREMRVKAEQIRDATSFAEAAQATGGMAAACGGCHARAEGGPHPEGTTTAPSAEEDTRSHMIQHAWAMDRLWEGLIVPSTDRCRAGARLLGEQPVAVHGVSPEVALISARVHEMGRPALDDATPGARAVRSGRLLTDCAACHAELGVW